MSDCVDRPRLRASIDTIRTSETPDGMITLFDRSGLAPGVVHVSRGALCLMSLMDGQRTVEEIRSAFQAMTHQSVDVGVIENLVDQLNESLLLEGPDFDAHYQAYLEHFRSVGTRPRLDRGEVADAQVLSRLLDEILTESPGVPGDDGVVGLIAPHLDYLRGRPCYAAAYAAVARRTPPERIVVIGTNHTPRTAAPVLSVLDFETALGKTRTDVHFIRRLEERCGDLRRFELDHVWEHSVELQVTWCQHLFGANRFELVPILCTDPTVAPDAFPGEPATVGVADVSRALRECMDADGKDTLIIAGADLSHVGEPFGDEEPLEPPVLDAVRRRDEEVLSRVRENDAAGFCAAFADNNNPTKVCSVGCIFALLTALPDARVELLRYHQAVDVETQTGVTCAAAVLRR